jgi:hypothetical protein
MNKKIPSKENQSSRHCHLSRTQLVSVSNFCITYFDGKITQKFVLGSKFQTYFTMLALLTPPVTQQRWLPTVDIQAAGATLSIADGAKSLSSGSRFRL